MKCLRFIRRLILGPPHYRGVIHDRKSILSAVDKAQEELSSEALKMRINAVNLGASTDDPLKLFTHSIRNARFQNNMEQGNF